MQMTIPGLVQELIPTRGTKILSQMTDGGERLPLSLYKQFFFLKVEFSIHLYSQRCSILVQLVLSGFQNYRGCYFVDDLLKHCDHFLCLMLPECPFPVFGMFLARDS